MGLVDSFSAEDRVEVKYSDFYRMVKAEAELQFLRNAVVAEVPYEEVLKMMTGRNSLLEEYRKTELTPDQIREMDRLYAEICKDKAILTAEKDCLQKMSDNLRETLCCEEGETATPNKKEP